MTYRSQFRCVVVLSMLTIASVSSNADTISVRSGTKTAQLVQNCIIRSIYSHSFRYYYFNERLRIVLEKGLERDGRELTHSISTLPEITQLLREWKEKSFVGIVETRNGKSITAFSLSVYASAPAGTNWIITSESANGQIYKTQLNLLVDGSERAIEFSELYSATFAGDGTAQVILTDKRVLNGKISDERFQDKPVELWFWGIDLAECTQLKIKKSLTFEDMPKIGKIRPGGFGGWYLSKLAETKSVKLVRPADITIP